MSQSYYFLLDDLAEYLGLEKREVAERLKTASEDIAIDFLKVNPQTEEEREEWYRKTDGYIYDLTNFTALRVQKGQIDEVAGLAKGRVLDWGCGIAEPAIRCARKGLDVTTIDLEGSRTFSYAKWRFKKHGVDIQTRIEGKYDTIICLDVLEHMEDPLGLVDYFSSILTEEGILILTTFFHRSNFLPMHLEHNEWLAEAFPSEMEGRGWELVHGEYNHLDDSTQVWRISKK